MSLVRVKESMATSMGVYVMVDVAQKVERRLRQVAGSSPAITIINQSSLGL